MKHSVKPMRRRCRGSGADAALQYQVSEGYLPLRRWLVAEMGRSGVACDEGNIFITSGSQQALDYLGKLFLSPSDTALVEWPTYLGALQAFNAYEPHYERLMPSGGNMTPEAYRRAAARAGGKAKFAYLVPDFANPTGQTLSRAERENALALATELEIAVIEDAAYRALRYDGAPVASILALNCARGGGIEAARTIYCGSFSKILAPGLRVGWVCASRAIVEKLVLIKQASDLHSPSINQIVVHRVAETSYATQVDKACRCYRARRDRMLAALDAAMPASAAWTRPEGGMFVWTTLPSGGRHDRPPGAIRVRGAGRLCAWPRVLCRWRRSQCFAPELHPSRQPCRRGRYPAARHSDCRGGPTSFGGTDTIGEARCSRTLREQRREFSFP